MEYYLIIINVIHPPLLSLGSNDQVKYKEGFPTKT